MFDIVISSNFVCSSPHDKAIVGGPAGTLLFLLLKRCIREPVHAYV